MNWHDVQDIAIELEGKFPDQDPLKLRFTELIKMVLELEGFEGKERDCNESILEAIQSAWISEKD